MGFSRIKAVRTSSWDAWCSMKQNRCHIAPLQTIRTLLGSGRRTCRLSNVSWPGDVANEALFAFSNHDSVGRLASSSSTADDRPTA
jgi:hypothetical protein